jgi:hypothetical protein
MKRDSGLPVPTALLRQAARQARAAADAPGRGRREPDLEKWARLTPAQRRQPKWRGVAAQWVRAASGKAGTIALLAGQPRLDGLDLSVEEARRLLGGEPDSLDPVIRAMRQSVDLAELPSGLFPPPEEALRPSVDLASGRGLFPRPEGKDR